MAADPYSSYEETPVTGSVTFHEDSGYLSFHAAHGKGASIMQVKVDRSDWRLIFSELIKDGNFAKSIRNKVLKEERLKNVDTP